MIRGFLLDHFVVVSAFEGHTVLIQDIVGGALVSSNGGQVHSLAFEFERSTTSLIQRIRS